MRSRPFRNLFAPFFPTFLNLTVKLSGNLDDTQATSVLQSKSLEYIEKWNESYGEHYRILRLGFVYLKDTLHSDFPNLREKRMAEAQARREEETLNWILSFQKYEEFRDGFSKQKEELLVQLRKVDEALNLLKTLDDNASARESEKYLFQLEEEADLENNFGNKLRATILGMETESSKVQRLLNMRPVYEELLSHFRTFTNISIPMTQEWLLILSKVEGADKHEIQQYLKSVLELNHLLKDALRKLSEEGITREDLRRVSPEEHIVDKIEDEVEWEDGQLEVDSIANDKEEIIQDKILALSEDIDAVSDVSSGEISDFLRTQFPESDSEDEKGVEVIKINKVVDPKKKELLDQAPVLPWGPHLENWESGHKLPADPRGLELDNHWGPINPEASVSQEKIQELSLRSSHYKPQKLPNRECKAPLKNGKLCTRRDFVKCPFHGEIVERDNEGKPVNEVEADTRAREPHLSFSQSKRARREAMRKHNEEVLKKAALASMKADSSLDKEIELSRGHVRHGKKDRKPTSGNVREKLLKKIAVLHRKKRG